MSLRDFMVKNPTERKSKGFTQKSMELVKKGNQMISLKEVRQLAKEFDHSVNKSGGKYVIRARNEYRDNLTIRDFNGGYYDDDDTYYETRAYQKDKFEKFHKLQIYFVK